jgi:hypothetical protein
MNELEEIRKEAVTDYCMIFSQHSPGGNEENHETLQQSLHPGRDSNLTPSEYKTSKITA